MIKLLKLSQFGCRYLACNFLCGTDEQTDLHALNTFSCSIDKVSFKRNSMSLGLVLLEKLFTQRPTCMQTQMPQSDAIISDV